MNRILRSLVYLLVAAFAAFTLSMHLPDAWKWVAFFIGLVLGAIANMAAILVSDHAEGGPRP